MHPGELAQLEERVLCKHEVIGSSPIFSTTLAFSSVGQSSRLITGSSAVRLREGQPFARMAELADALDLGSSALCVRVQISLRAPYRDDEAIGNVEVQGLCSRCSAE